MKEIFDAYKGFTERLSLDENWLRLAFTSPWERTHAVLTKLEGDWWQLGTLYWLDSETILVPMDEEMNPRTPQYFLLNKHLELKDSFELRFPHRAAFRSLRVEEHTGWMVMSWSKMLDEHLFGPFNTYVATVERDGAKGNESMFRSDCFPTAGALLPGRRFLAVYSGDFMDVEKRLNVDYDKRFEEISEEMKNQSKEERRRAEQDLSVDFLILDENQDRAGSELKSPRGTMFIESITEDFFCFFRQEVFVEDPIEPEIILTDYAMREIAKIVLSEGHEGEFFIDVAFAGDYMALLMDPQSEGSERGVYLFKIDWPDELRPSPPPSSEEVNGK